MMSRTHSEVPGPVVQLGSRSAASRAREVPLEFTLLYVVGFLMALPVVVVTRMLSFRVRDLHHESVFAETKRTVLTALGTAFMA